MAKASRKKRTKRSAVKRRSNPSTGAILAFVALGAAAAGGAWWFFSKKGGGRSVTRDTRSIRPMTADPSANLRQMTSGGGTIASLKANAENTEKARARRDRILAGRGSSSVEEPALEEPTTLDTSLTVEAV